MGAASVGRRDDLAVLLSRSVAGRHFDPYPSAVREPMHRPVLQRDVGFEYEVNRETYRANGPVPAHLRQIASVATPVWSLGPSLGKGVALVNIGGFHAKTDLGGTWGDTNLELEIDQVPETAAGRIALLTSLHSLEVFCELLDLERNAGFHHVSASKFAAALGGAAPVADAYIHAAANPTIGNPQATAGVRLDQVEQLMERTIGGPTAGPHVPGPGAPLARLELGILSDFGVVGDAPTHVRNGILAWYLGFGVGPPPLGFPSHALIGFCSVLLPYIIKAGGPMVAYAKQVAPLMARTDFGSMFVNDVPGPEVAWLQWAGGTRFRGMWTRILAQAGIVGGMGAPVLADALFAADPLSSPNAELPTALTRQAWLTGIVMGNDLFTGAAFPGVAPAAPLTAAQVLVLTGNGHPTLVPAAVGVAATVNQANYLTAFRRVQLFGLGQMAGAHDIVNVGAGGMNAPIFELRRIRQNIDAHTFTEMALGIYDYIVALNATAAGAGAAPYASAGRGISAASVPELANFLLAA